MGVDAVGCKHIGWVNYYQLDEQAGHTYVGIDLPGEETWGKGYGTEALCLLIDYLFGIPSMMSLARNWPLVPVTAENKTTAIIGSLAGPTVNLLLGYLGLLVYALSRREGFLKTTGMSCGLANSFLALIAAIVNLIVDLISGTRVNDLQVVSELVGINVLILPAIYGVLSVPALKFFWSKRASISEKKTVFILLLLGAWFFGGAFLMLLDAVFHIRFKIV